jgi:hypothetical protein
MYPRHAASYKCVLSNIDLLFESSTQDFLKSEIQTYRGLERKIHLALRFDSEAPTAFSLPITVRDYSNQDSKKEALYHTMAIDRTHFKNVPSDRYAIIPGGVPSLNDLLNCFRADVASVGGHSVERLITALNEFMDQYCGNEPQLPLVSLKPSPRVLITIYLVRLAEKLSKNLKAIALLAEYKNGFTDADKTYSALASKAVSSQILLVIKEGIRKEELLVLKYLEKLMYGAKGPGEENMIPLWACLWSLILTYRDCMNVYNQYSLAPRSNYKQPGCSGMPIFLPGICFSKPWANIMVQTMRWAPVHPSRCTIN